SCEVFTLASARDGRWGLASATTVSPIAQVGTDFPAELAMSRDGQTLYTALRGSNTISALRVKGSGEALEPFALTGSGVDWPRHHLVHEGVLLVAGQRSGTVSAIDLDERTGAPRDVRHTTSVPAPTVILAARGASRVLPPRIQPESGPPPASVAAQMEPGGPRPLLPTFSIRLHPARMETAGPGPVPPTFSISAHPAGA